VKRWDALIAVCGYLRSGLLGGEAGELPHELPWELLVEASSYHALTPALAWCLKDRTELPAEVRDYFSTMLALNAKRNDALAAALVRVVAACNAIGIQPVPLKGAARLVEDTYPAPSLRFLGDLDVLIPAERSADLVAALDATGFRADASETALPPSHHHLPMLHDREKGGGVELHIDVLNGDGGDVIATDWFAAGTRPVPFADLRIRLPDATRSVGHIVAHDQLQHRGYWDRKVELRQVLDLAMIRMAHAPEIDWSALDDRFCRAGLGEVLPTYLAMTEALLGQPAPRLSHSPRPGAIDSFRRVVEAGRLRRLALTVAGHLASSGRSPRSAREWLALRKWPGRIRLVIKALRQNAWSR